MLANVEFLVATENNTSFWAPVNYPRLIPYSSVPTVRLITFETKCLSVRSAGIDYLDLIQRVPIDILWK